MTNENMEVMLRDRKPEENKRLHLNTKHADAI
jgi:hypothetical protein